MHASIFPICLVSILMNLNFLWKIWDLRVTWRQVFFLPKRASIWAAMDRMTCYYLRFIEYISLSSSYDKS